MFKSPDCEVDMKTVLIAIALATASLSVSAQTYKCKVNGASVIQDQPCPGSVRRADSMPVQSAAATASDDEIQAKREKLEQDKRFIDERVKARVTQREKESAERDIAKCDSQASGLLAKVNQLAANAPTGRPVNLASAAALQLDQQRRQTEMQSLQAQHSAKLAQCARMRDSFKDKYGP